MSQDKSTWTMELTDYCIQKPPSQIWGFTAQFCTLIKKSPTLQLDQSILFLRPAVEVIYIMTYSVQVTSALVRKESFNKNQIKRGLS
jgi:hypothetical protein